MRKHKERVKNAQVEHELAREAVQKTSAALLSLNDGIAELRRVIEEQEIALADLSKAFAGRFVEAGFQDEAAFLAACLSDEKREALSQKSERLERDRAESETRLHDAKKRLETEIGRAHV